MSTIYCAYFLTAYTVTFQLEYSENLVSLHFLCQVIDIVIVIVVGTLQKFQTSSFYRLHCKRLRTMYTKKNQPTMRANNERILINPGICASKMPRRKQMEKLSLNKYLHSLFRNAEWVHRYLYISLTQRW